MTGRAPVSVIVLTFNEQANIDACLASVAEWAGEIWVVDSGSRDETLERARRYTDQIASHPFDNYSESRNWAQRELALAHEWVLHIDADERVSAELRSSIERFLASPTDGPAAESNGAMFSRRTVFMGRWIRHGGHYPTYHTRLFRRDRGRCEQRLYDQHFLVDPPVTRLHGDLIDVLTHDLDSWSTRHIRWAGREAQQLLASGAEGETELVTPRATGTPVERRRWLRQHLFGRAPRFWRAFFYFFYRYVIRLGFLDGREGLDFHFLQACWFRFYVDAKMWERERASSQLGVEEPPE